MKYSTGQGTRVRHSTATEWDELYVRKKSLKYSTGRGPAIRHFTGTESGIPDDVEEERRPPHAPCAWGRED